MSNNENSKVALVTGSSTGIGFETCLALARSGFVTCATMRDKKCVQRWNLVDMTSLIEQLKS